LFKKFGPLSVNSSSRLVSKVGYGPACYTISTGWALQLNLRRWYHHQFCGISHYSTSV